tara:strand:+ start:394 stop:708 length:315 start_codon:yes stop_codon:yes gene_type:complete
MNLSKSSKEEKNEEPDFASWIRVFRPPANVPDWIKANIVVDLVLLQSLWEDIKTKATEDKKVRMVLKESKSQHLYIVYDTYVKDKEVSSSSHSPDRDNEDDLPI